MRRFSFRSRVFLLTVAVALSTAGATAWLAFQQTNEQAVDLASSTQFDIDRAVDAIVLHGLLRMNWEDAGTQVAGWAAVAGQRVRVTTTDGITLADSAPDEGNTTPRFTLVAQTRPKLRLERIDPAKYEGIIDYVHKRYLDELSTARCAADKGREVRITTGDLGQYSFGAALQGMKPCLSSPQPNVQLDESCVRDQDCVQRRYADVLARSTPPPVQVLIGNVEQKPARPIISPGPALAAAGLVALVVTAASLLISRRVVRPIDALVTASGRLGEGDLDERVPERGDDELTQLSRSFNRMAESLQRSKRQQHNMIADIAHELRTPIANIRGYLEAVQDGVLPADGELFRSLHEEALLQQRLIADLQELALAESGDLVYYPSRTDLAELLHSARNAHATSTGVRIDVDAPQPVLVTVDQDRFRQVIGNLLTNALRATPPDGLVVLRARADGDQVVITVADNGCGISAQDLPHVFDRFWRADAARRRGTGGRGLGLAITKEIVTAHGGTITAAGREGVGSAFTVRLPRDHDPSGTPEPRLRRSSAGDHSIENRR
jgi:two-component system sensor histidine kinase BaeS